MRPTPRTTRLDAGSTLVTCSITDPTYTYSSLLLTKVERLNQPYVALVSTATEGFLTVEPPPHKLALLVHGHLPEHPTSNPDPNPNPNPNPNPSPNPNPLPGRTDELSLRSTFAVLPSRSNLTPTLTPTPTITLTLTLTLTLTPTLNLTLTLTLTVTR